MITETARLALLRKADWCLMEPGSDNSAREGLRISRSRCSNSQETSRERLESTSETPAGYDFSGVWKRVSKVRIVRYNQMLSCAERTEYLLPSR